MRRQRIGRSANPQGNQQRTPNVLRGLQKSDEQANEFRVGKEIDTGKTWIEGQPIYRFVFDFGALPNATTKTMDPGLGNVQMVEIRGIASNGRAFLPLPWPSTTAANSITLHYDTNKEVSITTGNNYSSYGTVYIILEYIK
jgi:hypothetical protein